jgi:hypothetical protein
MMSQKIPRDGQNINGVKARNNQLPRVKFKNLYNDATYIAGPLYRRLNGYSTGSPHIQTRILPSLNS